MSANDRQVGGTHYVSEHQHWDFIEENGIGYLEAAATKYLMRWRQKNGVQDLEKSLHYSEKLLELHVRGDRNQRGCATHSEVQRFCRVNNLPDLETTIVAGLMRWRTTSDLRIAISYLKRLIQMAAAESF